MVYNFFLLYHRILKYHFICSQKLILSDFIFWYDPELCQLLSLRKTIFTLLKLVERRDLITYLAQLKQIGVFDKISGLLIGTFTKIEKEISVEELFELVKEYIPEHLPVVKTSEVGHAKDSKVLKIGEMMNIKNELV